MANLNRSRIHALQRFCKDKKTVLVSNLRSSVTEDDIIILFHPFGDVDKICDIKNGFTEVSLSTAEAAAAVVEKFNGRNLDGQPIFLRIKPSPPLKLNLDVNKKTETPTPLLKLNPEKKVKPVTVEPEPLLSPPDAFIANPGIFDKVIPENTKPGDILEIMVGEVIDPSNFWFQMRSNGPSLDAMMCVINDFYNDTQSKKVDFSMHPAHVKPGQFCAALYKKIWHRAKILRVEKDKMVEIMYVDYGTMATIRQKELKYLHKSFSRIPMQAIKGSLHGIEPKFGKWMSNAGREFLKLVWATANSGLIGEVKGVNEDVVSLWLYDTVSNNLPNGIELNTELCRRGLAVFTENQQQYVKVQDKNCLAKRQPPIGKGHSPDTKYLRY